MRYSYYLSFLLFMLTQVGFSQVLNRSFVERDSTVILLGEVTVDRFQESPFSNWYLPGQSNETTPSDTLALLARAWDHMDSLTLFIGTWCGDSRRGFPKIVSLLQASDFDMTKLKVICVDHSKSAYKQSPDGEQVGQNIHRVPTLLVHDEEGEEMNRIVERPLYSWATDLLLIVEGTSYEPSYRAVTFLNKLLSESDALRKINEDKENMVATLKVLAKHAGELNTYARVLSTSFRLAEAEMVYELNALLYPDFYVGQYYLSVLKMQLAKYQEAYDIIADSNPPERWLETKEQLIAKLQTTATLR